MQGVTGELAHKLDKLSNVRAAAGNVLSDGTVERLHDLIALAIGDWAGLLNRLLGLHLVSQGCSENPRSLVREAEQ